MGAGKEKLLRFYRHELQDWEPEMAASLRRLVLPICERPVYGTGYDSFGVHWTDRAEVGGGCHYTQGQAPIITDMSNWRNQIYIPNPDKADWSMFEKQANAVDRDEYLTICTIITGPFERTTSLMRFEDCLVNYLLEPEEMEALVSAIVDYKIRLVKKAFRHGSPDVILLHDDWGTAKGPILNPETWEAILKPHTKRLYDAVKEGGAFLGMHCCGSIDMMMDQVAELGFDYWEAQMGCNNYEQIKKRFPVSLAVGDASMAMRPEVVKGIRSIFESVEGNVPFYDTVPYFLYD